MIHAPDPPAKEAAPTSSPAYPDGALPERAGPRERSVLADEIHRRTGLNPARCYQCGKCSAGCPMATETDLRPHDILRLVTLNQRGKLLASPSLWLCLGCETCTARCPNECDPAAVIDVLRSMAVEEAPSAVPKALGAFHRSFLDQIRSRGRVAEVGLMAAYKLRSGAVLQDVSAGPGMVSRGKLRLPGPRVRGIEEVRALFRACEEEERR